MVVKSGRVADAQANEPAVARISPFLHLRDRPQASKTGRLGVRLCQHPEPTYGLSLNVELDQQCGFVSQAPPIVPRLDNDYLWSYDIDLGTAYFATFAALCRPPGCGARQPRRQFWHPFLGLCVARGISVPPGPRMLRRRPTYGEYSRRWTQRLFAASGAVGTIIADRPPHRSERAQFRHSAPTLGV